MSNVLEIPESGFVSLKVGESVTQIDCYEAWNTVRSLRDEAEDAGEPMPQAFHRRVAEWLASKGVPAVSHFQVDVFVQRLGAAVVALKKSTDPTPGSQASTAPAPSASPEA